MVLKIITYLFTKEYDYIYSDNCYSFRRNKGIKNAIRKIINHKGIHKLYGYKIDNRVYNNYYQINLTYPFNLEQMFLKDNFNY